MIKAILIRHVSQETEKDDFNNGLTGERQCVFSQLYGEVLAGESANVAGLVKWVNDNFYAGVTEKDLSTTDSGNISFNYLVDVDNCKATENDIQQWKQGKKVLWLCDTYIVLQIIDILDVNAADYLNIEKS